MTCREIKRQLIPWLDGELSPAAGDRLKACLEGCAKARHCSDCHKLIADYRNLDKALAAGPKQEFPAHLHYRILEQVQNRGPVLHRKAVRTRWQAIPATLAIAMSLYAGSLIGIKTFHNQTPAPLQNSEQYNFGGNSLVAQLDINGELE